ncbi:hypothetical protein [Yersinia rohdei]|uniref:hypothetical protein n=1 Tax=Yersinia rohdei TaxID=29485 RepID=UPI0011AAA443|nr:hypothetical protein [Yersinia rohdei]
MNKLTEQQLQKIANPGESDIKGTQNPVVTEMAIELLSLREQLAEKEERLCRLRTSLEIEMKGHEAAERQLAELKGEWVPVAVVELNDNITVAEIRGDIPRRKAVRELYEGALVIGQELFTAAKPAEDKCS